MDLARLRLTHLRAAALYGGVLLLACLLDVGPDHARLAGFSGPHCALRALAGERACPGCGLTRSTALAVQGRIGTAFRVHPAGPVVALLCVAGLGLHAWALLRGERPAARALLRAGRFIFLAALLGGWAWRLTAG